MAVKRLAPGEYLEPPCQQWRRAGLLLTLSSYRAGLTHSWHVHAHPTIFVLLNGAHHDQSRQQMHDQPVMTAVFHPVTEPHATEVGPEGMLGLNVEYPDGWLAAHDLHTKDLTEHRLMDSTTSCLNVLRILGTLSASVPRAEADLETAAIELLEPLVVIGALPHQMRSPSWFRRAEEFLRQSFHLPISLRSVAREVGVHPVYCARVFRRLRGCSISAYLRALRLVEAGRLIVQEGHSLASAAHRAGFADQAHFCRRCAQVLGFSPKALRLSRQAVQQLKPGFKRSRLPERTPYPDEDVD